jgi:hypothetical protein
MHVVASAYALAMRPRLSHTHTAPSLHMDLRSTPEAMAKVTPWVVWANAALDPILFLENDRGQVIGTRLTQNPRQIQVRASSPSLSFTLFLPPIPPAPRPHPRICILRSLALSLARSHLFLALSLSRSLARCTLSLLECVCMAGPGKAGLAGTRFAYFFLFHFLLGPGKTARGWEGVALRGQIFRC